MILVYVVDGICGSGKTMGAINYINSAPPDIRFLYITPYLTEVDRIIKSCPSKAFKQPSVLGSKLDGIKYLFNKGENIVSTHRLFSMFDDEIIDIAYNKGYVLILDEVVDVIDMLTISRSDKNNILDKYAEVGFDNILKWKDDTYDGKYDDYKRLCELGCVGVYNDEIFVWLFPVKTFKAFHNIYILTYMFDAQMQKYYYDYYNIEYKHLYVTGDTIDTYRFCDDPLLKSESSADYKQLINICDISALNEIGDLEGSLSKGWYDRNKKNSTIFPKLRANCENFFRHHANTPSNLNLWTTFKEYKDSIKGRGYTKGFLSSNCRATNEYRDRISVAYLINKYFNPYIKNFFVTNGIEVDEDSYALSELLQFLFRSAIREENKISLYIPSNRMRVILEAWLDSFNYSENEGGETE